MKSHSSHNNLPPENKSTNCTDRSDHGGNNHSPQATMVSTTSTLKLLDFIVPDEGVDYNGHMTEYRYLQVLGETTDALLRLIGADLDYVAAGHSYYTVETHIRHLRETKTGEAIHSHCQVLSADDKRLHVFHTIVNSSTGETLATGEHLLLHVDMTSGKTCRAKPHHRKGRRDSGSSCSASSAAGRRTLRSAKGSDLGSVN